MLKNKLENEINSAIQELYNKEVDFSLERGKFGDYSTSVALTLRVGAPNKTAENITTKLNLSSAFNELVERTEITGAGFINFYLRDEAVVYELNDLLKKIDEPLASGGPKINLEFISANPTGKLHIGHGRGAFYGDILANILNYSGAKVTREFYINDSRESAQIRELGKTALGRGEQYKTAALDEMIKKMDFAGMSEEDAGFALADAVQQNNRNFIERTLSIQFDNWYSEDEKLRASGANRNMLAKLDKAGLVYEKEGARWLKTSEYGDDEDRVLVRSDGTFSYFLSDIAYHADKFTRGYNAVLDIWGADHHGHVKRMQAVHKMLGWKGAFKVFITQLVTLQEGGEAKKMSKRAGTVILLEDLVREFGIDVVRWFFAEKALSTHMEFDAELAREQSAKNPVYYVQYAHARITSILAKLGERTAGPEIKIKNFSHPSERELAKKITAFPEVLADIAEDYQVHHLTTYTYELAHAFTMFYRDVKVIEENGVNENALALVLAARRVIKKSLELLGINAPDKM